MERVRKWWFLWWDEVMIILGVSTALILFIYGMWYLFQTQPFPLEEGRVVGHSYTAQYEEYHDGGSTCVSYNKHGGCSWSVQNPDIHHVHCRGGCFEIQIDGCSNDRRGDSHCRKEWQDVSEHTYNNCEKGSTWYRDEPDCPIR